MEKIASATGRISSLLRMLAEIRECAEGLALFDAVTLIIERTQLRERLLLLPATEFGDLARELDALIAQAAQAEANGMILPGFAEQLRNDFASPRAIRFSADDNAIQLITSYKAKGSEWQAVIVPFLARELRTPSPRYPHFVKSPADGELIIAFGVQDKSKDLKDAIERAEQQQLERLLYVATTRARHTLVVVLDQEIFSSSDGKLLKTAQLRRLIRDKDFYSGDFDQHTSTIDQVHESLSMVEHASQENGSEIERLTNDDIEARCKMRFRIRAKDHTKRYRHGSSGRGANALAPRYSGHTATAVGGTNFSNVWIGKVESTPHKSYSNRNCRFLPMPKLR